MFASISPHLTMTSYHDMYSLEEIGSNADAIEFAVQILKYMHVEQ